MPTSPPTTTPTPAVISPENVDRIQQWRVFPYPSWLEWVTFSPDGTVLACGTGNGSIWLYDLQQDRELLHFTAHSGQVHTVVFSPDGTRLYSGGVDEGGGRIRAWDWRTGTELWSVVTQPKGWGARLGISHDGQWLASHNILWRVSDRGLEQYATLSDSGDVPTFSPDDRWIAFREDKAGVRLKSVEGSESRLLSDPGSTGYFVAFSPDSSLITAGADSRIRVWRVADGLLLRTLEGHTAFVNALAFSPDGRVLASQSNDDTVRLWRVSDGKLLHTLIGNKIGGTVAFSPDGCTLASGWGGYVRLWRARQ